MAYNNEYKKNVGNEQQVADVSQNTDNAVAMQPNAGTSVQSSNDTTNNTKGVKAGGSGASAVSSKYTAPKFEFDTSDLAKQKLERVTIPDDIAKQRAEAQKAQIDYYEQKKQSHMRDAEQDAKTAKRLKRGKLIGSIVDASRALANLWGTTNYAPNAYTGKDSMADAYQKKYDEWNAKVKADKDAYDAAYSKLIGAKADNADENYKNWRELQKTNVEIDKHNSNIGQKELDYKFKTELQNNQVAQFNAEQALKEQQQKEKNAIEKEKLAAQKEKERRIASGVGRSSGGGGRRGGSGSGSGSGGGGRSSGGSKITFTSKSGKRFTLSGVNEATVKSIFETLPQNVKKQYRRFAFGEPSKIEMIQAIESQLDDNKILQGYIKRYMR